MSQFIQIHMLTSYPPACLNRDDLNRLVGMVCDWMEHMLAEMPDAPHAPLFREVVRAWTEGNDLVLHQAPALILAYSSIQTGTEPTDAAISLAYLDLAALSLGLGGCWAGLFTMAAKSWGPLEGMLGLPEGHHLHGAIMVGYPKFRFQRLPVRNQPKILWR